jgi:hypothetical protein
MTACTLSSLWSRFSTNFCSWSRDPRTCSKGSSSCYGVSEQRLWCSRVAVMVLESKVMMLESKVMVLDDIAYSLR